MAFRWQEWLDKREATQAGAQLHLLAQQGLGVVMELTTVADLNNNGVEELEVVVVEKIKAGA